MTNTPNEISPDLLDDDEEGTGDESKYDGEAVSFYEFDPELLEEVEEDGD